MEPILKKESTINLTTKIENWEKLSEVLDRIMKEVLDVSKSDKNT